MHAPFCKLCWSWQHQQVCHFSSYLTLALSSPLCPLFHLSFYLILSGRNCLLSPPVLLGYNESTSIRFSQGTTRLMSCPDGERCLSPLQSLVVSLSTYLSYPLSSFLRLEAYCLIEILRHTSSHNFH